ncbi:hypothetical protein [Actinomyces sp.]
MSRPFYRPARRGRPVLPVTARCRVFVVRWSSVLIDEAGAWRPAPLSTRGE